MNCNQVEKSGLSLLTPFLQKKFSELAHLTDKGDQLTCGDFSGKRKGVLEYVEVKTELKNPNGNFFLETWSNVRERRRGWMWNLTETSWLCYIFLEPFPVLYVVRFKPLQKWFKKWLDQEPLHWGSSVSQRKTIQENHTRGKLVPIEEVRSQVGLKEYAYVNTKWEKQDSPCKSTGIR